MKIFRRNMTESFKKSSFYQNFDNPSPLHKYVPYRATGLGPEAHSSLLDLIEADWNGQESVEQEAGSFLIFPTMINKKSIHDK